MITDTRGTEDERHGMVWNNSCQQTAHQSSVIQSAEQEIAHQHRVVEEQNREFNEVCGENDHLKSSLKQTQEQLLHTKEENEKRASMLQESLEQYELVLVELLFLRSITSYSQRCFIFPLHHNRMQMENKDYRSKSTQLSAELELVQSQLIAANKSIKEMKVTLEVRIQCVEEVRDERSCVWCVVCGVWCVVCGVWCVV